MTSFTGIKQERRPRGSDPVASHYGHLYITAAPVGSEALVGKRLLDAGELPEGDYRCEIMIDGWEKGFDVVLRPSDVTGSFAPSARTLLLDRATAKTTVAGTNFADDTTQTIVFPASGSLTGEVLAVVTFTVPAGGALEFDSAGGAIAEFSGR
jgi:hypothetical protein